jgi:hypothetical protein
MKNKKLVDWDFFETIIGYSFCDVLDEMEIGKPCDLHETGKCRPDDCPIWASLEDAPFSMPVDLSDLKGLNPDEYKFTVEKIQPPDEDDTDERETD